MSYATAETGRVKSIKSKFENLNSLESLDISVTVPNKYRKPSPKFLFKRSSTSIDLPINRIAVGNENKNKNKNKNNNNNNINNDAIHCEKKTSPIKLATFNSDAKSIHLRNHNYFDRTTSADTFAVKKRSLIANGEDKLKPLKELKETIEGRLARHTNDPIKRSSIKRSPAFRVGDKSTSNNNTSTKPTNNVNTSNSKENKLCGKTKCTKSSSPSEFSEKFENFLKRCDIETKQDLYEPGLTDTLKAFLRQPLPSGPPPKKPPRTFIDSPKQVQKIDDTSNGSEDEKNNISKIQPNRQSPVHCAATTSTSASASTEMKQKIDLLENQLILKTNNKTKVLKTPPTKEKGPFSSSLLNCIPCSSTAIYDKVSTKFGKIPSTSRETSPETNTLNKCTMTTATTLKSNRRTASRCQSEPIYMEPFAHLKYHTKTLNVSSNTCKHNNNNNNNHNNNSFNISSPTSSHLSNIEPKLSSSSLSNGSFDGPESIGSSLTSCTSCTADDHSISDLNDIHYMCTSIENKLKSSDSDSISNENDQPITLSNTYDEINILVSAAFGQHKSSDSMGNTVDIQQMSPTMSIATNASTSSDAQRKASTKLSRTLTEKRKDYVRRVSAVKQIPDLNNESPHQTFKPSVFRTFSIENTDETSINSNNSSKNGADSDQSPIRNGNVIDERKIDDCQNDDTTTDEIEHDDNCNVTVDEPVNNASKLFQVCLLIGFNNSTRQPYIKSKFPSDEEVPLNIEQLVFPSPNVIQQTRINQDYSLILTDNNGYHIYGYCRRVLPESCEICLPLAYCIISEVKAPGFYFKILKEIETRHGQAEFQTTFLLQSLQMRSIPCAGKFIHVKLPLSPRPKTMSSSHHHKVTPKRLSLEVNPKWLTESAAQAAFNNCETTTNDTIGGGGKTDRSSNSKSLVQEFEEKKQLNNGAPFDLSLINRSLFGKTNNGKCDEIFIRRPNDLRLESTELSDLYQALGPDLLITVFSSLLLERKVILYTENISILSSCVLGLQTLLYPFQWQHTIITILPDSLVDICQAPIPVLAGLLEPITFDIEDGIVIDLNQRQLVQKCGDETTILPSSLSHSLKVSLEMVDLLDQGKMLSSVLIAEAFLRCFVELFVGYKHKYYDKKLFIESHSSRSYSLFLEWFVETAMFRHFVHQKYTKHENSGTDRMPSWIADSNFYDLFDSRIWKNENESNSTQQNMEMIMKNCKVINKKGKTFKDRFKDFISSNNS